MSFEKISWSIFQKSLSISPKSASGEKRIFLENFKTYSPYSPMKRETPVYKGFERGLPSRDTHQDSHPDTHHQGESEVNSYELRPHSSVVQVTNWVTIRVSIWVSIYFCKTLYLSAFQRGWVSMVRVFLFPVLFFALEHKSSGDVVTGTEPEVVEF